MIFGARTAARSLSLGAGCPATAAVRAKLGDSMSAFTTQQQCRRERIVSAATLSNAAVIDGTATVPSREWWRREAARLGSDWNGLMELRASVAPLACGV